MTNSAFIQEHISSHNWQACDVANTAIHEESRPTTISPRHYSIFEIGITIATVYTGLIQVFFDRLMSLNTVLQHVIVVFIPITILVDRSDYCDLLKMDIL